MTDKPEFKNPYQAPQSTFEGPSEITGVRGGTLMDLRGVAQAQKGIIACIAFYFCLIGAQFAVPPGLRMYLPVVLLILLVTSAYCVVKLGFKVYQNAWGIALGIACLIPCIGLLVLLRLNGKATEVLRQNGIKVGLFGANMSKFDDPNR